MKNHFLILSFLLTISFMFYACEKEEIDIRDSYIGTYQGTEKWTNGGTEYTRDINLTVSKSSTDESSVILSAKFYKTETELVTVKVTNGRFSESFVSVFSGATRTITILNGNFGEQKITYSYSSDGYVSTLVNATKL